jgi:hypothetical protein
VAPGGLPSVLLNEGKKQRYGTMPRRGAGNLVPRPIDDEAQVDQRSSSPSSVAAPT